MRAESLPRFQQSLIAVRVGALFLLHLIALTVLLVFDVTGAAATGAGPSYDWIDPFRWG